MIFWNAIGADQNPIGRRVHFLKPLNVIIAVISPLSVAVLNSRYLHLKSIFQNEHGICEECHELLQSRQGIGIRYDGFLRSNQIAAYPYDTG